MAQRVQVLLTDDIDGSEASETVNFGLDGTLFEIDLNDENASKLRESLAPFMGAARRQRGATSGRPRRMGQAAPKDDSGKIREWAKANGFEVSDRGRVSAKVREAYEKAH